MSKLKERKVVVVVSLLLLVLVVAIPAYADVIVTIAAAPGTDLGNVHVGDWITLDTYASSPDAGEHLLLAPDVHLLGSGYFGAINGYDAPTWSNDLSTNPIIAIWNVQVTGVGSFTLYNGWPGCTPSPSYTRECAVTNLGDYRPADSNVLSFNVQPIPEPASLMLLGSGLLTMIGVGRKLSRK